jgi:recombination protein RecR
MPVLPPAVTALSRALMVLPSVGERSATRMAHFLLAEGRSAAEALSRAIEGAMSKVHLCKRCQFFAEDELCALCQDDIRERTILCVVEKPLDVVAIERSREYHGLYHVLHGIWSPVKGRGHDCLGIERLSERIDSEGIDEVILALGMTVEGDATCLYLAQALSSQGVKVTRLAQGMPKGGELEFTDERTLSRAFSGRSSV